MTTTTSPHPLSVAVVTGSTRPNRRSLRVAEWFVGLAAEALAGRADVALLDIADFDLPLLDEPTAAAVGEYTRDHTLRWADAVAEFDAFVFVTPEYNHSMPAALKNAIDFLFAEWTDKAAGLVGYGLDGGVRAVEHLRLTLAEVKVACVRSSVPLSLSGDFDGDAVVPSPRARAICDRMLDELIDWATALRSLRTESVS
ncbi:NADPH-dependent FMN reductase [Gordonia humi]|uniref:NAD(P)H-dependent FMN reductase n=1 Tax=Gordonia humi TaxID=686429 RepID=A0A840EX01_9ACTN|nr:NAD(P)H-dependent oxidoreductase [Gordonia humi]MBB4134346.1 NAD(P)H-dependent FMN reductase [Gordonia humi]